MDNKIDIIVGARDATRVDLDDLRLRLAEFGKTVATAKINADDKGAQATIARIAEQYRRLNGRVISSTFKLDGVPHAEVQIAALTASMDRLNNRTVTSSALKGAFKGVSVTPLGVAAALSPGLIPVATGLAAALSAVTVSLGAATIGFGAFGLMAKTAFSQVQQGMASLSTATANYMAASKTLNIAIHQSPADMKAYQATIHGLEPDLQSAAKLLTDQKATWQSLTPAQQKSTIALANNSTALKALLPDQKAALQALLAERAAWLSLSPAQRSVAASMSSISDKWGDLSKNIATPVLVPWLKDVTLLMGALPGLVRPVADLFQYWGEVLNRYLSSKTGSAEIQKIADELGRFSAMNLSYLINFFVDLGKGIAALARDVSAHGVDFYAFGKNLQSWGAAFAQWAQSASARHEVNSFLTYVHDHGSVILSILKDIGKYLPGIFAGASAAGTAELQALSSLLGFVAKLPAGFAKPLTELAGALLLLQKTGVIKVGLNLVGMAGEHPYVAGFTIGTLLAAGIIAAVNQKRPGHGNQTWWQSFGPPDKGQQQTWLNSWSGLGDRIVQLADDVRHGVASAWDLLWNNTLGRTVRGGHDVEAEFNTWRHNTATIFDGVRHDIASAWDAIWHNTASQVSGGVNNVIGFFRTLPGRVIGALKGLGTDLWNLAKGWLSDLLHGAESEASSIYSWFSGFVSKILGFFSHLLHHSPTGEFYYMGRNMMEGLAMGLKDHAHLVAGSIKGVTGMMHPTGSGGSIQALMQSMARSIGWTGSQWDALYNVEMREAGFNMSARNPGSGAYGLAQFINGPSEYYQYGGNPNTAAGQITGMLNYIRERYGSPMAAWAHELSAGWYDQGGWLPTGVSLAVNKTGRPERILGPGESQHVVLEISPGGGTLFEQFMVTAIRNWVRTKGGGNVQKAFGHA